MHKNRGIVAYMFAMYLYLGLYFSMIQRIVSEIAVTYSLDHTSLGTIIMMTFIGYTISPILTGEIADRFGRKILMLLTFIGMLCGFVIVLTTGSAVGVGAGLLVIGMAFGIFEMALSAILIDLRPDSANRVMNNSRLFFALGTVSGPFVAYGVIALTNNWVYVMVGAIALLTALFVVFLIISFPKPKYPNPIVKETATQSYTLQLLKKPAVIMLGISIMMYVAVEAGLTFYVSSYMKQITSDEIMISLTLSTFWLLVAVGRFITGRYKRDLNVLIASIALLACAGLVICLLTNDLVLSIVAFGIMGLGCSGIFPTLLAVGKIRLPKYVGTVFGILLSVAGIGGMVHPQIMGAVADTGGLKIALATCLVPLAVIIMMQVVLRRLGKRKMHETNDTEAKVSQE